MDKILKKIGLASVALVGFVFGLMVIPRIASAVYNQYQATKFNDVTVSNLLVRDTGLYDSGGTARLKLGSTVEFTSGQIGMGAVGTVQSTATTTGNSLGQSITCYLTGATPALEGSLLVSTTPVAGQGASVIVAPASNGVTGWVGVAKAAASTGAVVNVYYDGFILGLTTGTVNPGDVLVSSSTSAGYLGANNSPTSGTDVGIAMSGGNTAGGRTLIRIR